MTVFDPWSVLTAKQAAVARAYDAVDVAWPTSVLPPDAPPAAVEAVDAWLREVRRASW